MGLVLWLTGKLVEEEEGNFGLWLSYLFTGVGANLVSWLVLPRNAVSVGASGAVFGLFAISVLVKVLYFSSLLVLGPCKSTISNILLISTSFKTDFVDVLGLEENP